MALNANNTEITAPVSVSDVRTALAVDSYDVGYLCSNTHGKINRWSKYKPVRINSDFIDRTTEWWRGTAQNCGLVVVTTNDYHNIPSLYTEILMTAGWDYEAPSLTASPYFRLLDFEMYKHDALPPLRSFVCDNKVAPNGQFTASFELNPIGEESKPTSVGMQHIIIDDKTLSEYYFGIIFTKQDGTFVGRATGPNAGTNYVDITLNDFFTMGATYMVYPFMSKKKMDFLDSDTQVDNVFIPFPCVRVGTAETSVKIVSREEAQGLVISLTATVTGNTSISGTLRIKAEKPNRVYGTIYCRVSPIGSALENADRMEYFSEHDIAAGEEWSLPFSFTDLDSSKISQYFIHLILHANDAVFEKTAIPLRPAG